MEQVIEQADTIVAQQFFEEYGFLILPDFIDAQTCAKLRNQAAQLSEQANTLADDAVIFDTSTNQHAKTQYFLDSADKIAYFFENTDLDTSEDSSQLLNKIGHALHDKDPVFQSFSYQEKIINLFKALGLANPVIAQSMYIFKHPHIGGEVNLHQDSTFIYTEPDTCLGLWFALEDATVDNGCLWAIPGGHKYPLRQLYTRCNGQLVMQTLSQELFDEKKTVPLAVSAGTVIALHGRLPHMSYRNQTAQSRQAYTLHAFEQTAQYAETNWLQREF